MRLKIVGHDLAIGQQPHCSGTKSKSIIYTDFKTCSHVRWAGRHGILLPQVSLVARLCPSLCNPMDCSMPGFPVHYQLSELAQTHALQVSDAIQPFHPLLSPFSPAFDLYQHQNLFQWVSFSHQVAKVLGFQLQHQAFNKYSELISFRTDFSRTGWISLQSKGLSRVFSNTTVQKHQFFGIQLSL